ncbi:pantothenate transporter [Grosmannia clavigera kw1407]|uniref:Pantothenate transporter n=1 Tax=Grosmannia clavigera (strain kw1407 / UAMH 11150) TaxID=655863 RepID=F0XJK4_GROCL|nr:pantothenate transporter [Grosmannia clavigera kw1407]EFX02194.1 pantothenate transporter [Grosmannia clavigera kw1407]
MASLVKETAVTGINATASDEKVDVTRAHETGSEKGRTGPADRRGATGEISAKEERAFVWRLDLGLLVVGFLGYTFKYLDQTNISNAYVSGMKEELHLEGDELNYFTTYFNQWYLPDEIALRMSIYNVAQPTGAMLSGAMQGSLATNLDGILGRSGWRWAFIINPERQNPLSKYYMKPRHIVKSFLRCFSFWQLWLVAIAWPIGGNTTPSGYFNLWLKSLKNPDGTKKYSVGMLNYLPIIGQAVQFVAEILFNGFSDLLGARLPFLLLHSAISITSLIILIIRPSNHHSYMAGWYLNYVGGVSTMLLCSWAATHLQSEPEVRTVLFASGTILAYLLSAFVPLAAYPAKQAPNWHIGAKLYLGFAVASTILFIVIHFAFRYEKTRQASIVPATDGTGLHHEGLGLEPKE